MQDDKCPKCGSTEFMKEVTVLDVGNNGPYPLHVEIMEPEPAKRPFMWTPKSARGEIRAWICAQCG